MQARCEFWRDWEAGTLFIGTHGGEWSGAVGSIGLAPYALRGFNYRGLHNMNEETLRFLALRGWLRMVVGCCTWCATRHTVRQVEKEAGRPEPADKEGQCCASLDEGRTCEAKLRLFLPSMPRKGETATEMESVACPKCRARAYSVAVGTRTVVVCWKCAEAERTHV